MKNGGACGDAVNTQAQFDFTLRMVKEKLGLRVPMSQDPSVPREMTRPAMSGFSAR